MKVVIPVAGVGARLKPHTHTNPKSLLEIAGQPILKHILDPINKLKPSEVIFVIGYKGEQIRKYVEDNYKFKSTFIEQDKLLGLGYAVGLAMPKVGKSDLLIILGDTIVESDLKKFISRSDYSLGVMTVDNPKRFGIAAVGGGFVSKLQEKPENPESNLALIGLYYFKESKTLRDELKKLVKSGQRTKGEIQLTDALQAMIKRGTKFTPFEVTGWFDCGTKETTLLTNQHFLKKIPETKSIDGCHLIPPVYISKSAKVEQSTIGPNVSVGDKTFISNSSIANSIVGDNSRIEKATLKDSFVGCDVVVKGYNGVLNIGDNSEINCN